MTMPFNLPGADPKPGTPVPPRSARWRFHSKQKSDVSFESIYRWTITVSLLSLPIVHAKPKDHGPFELRDDFGEEGGLFHKDIKVPAGKTVYRQVNQHARQNGWDPFFIFTLLPTKDGDKEGDAMIAGLSVHKNVPKLRTRRFEESIRPLRQKSRLPSRCHQQRQKKN